MKTVLSYKPLHFLIGLIAGILLEYYIGFAVNFPNYFYGLLALFCCFFIVLKNTIKTVLGILVFFCLGVLLMFQRIEKNHQNYFENYLTKDAVIKIKLIKRLKSNAYNDIFIANVITVSNKKTIGKILLHIQKDSTLYLIDDEFITKKQPIILHQSLNPYQFSMQNWMQKQDVHQQLFLQENDYIHFKNQPKTSIGFAEEIRNKILNSLKNQQLLPSTISMISALLLGDRQYITEDVIKNYTNAGAIHILAISGLHIGILLYILNFLLKPIEVLPFGNQLKLAIIIIILWLFAMIAGLSASIVRAVTMFTFFAIGLMISKPKVMYFSIITSLFILLIYNPLYLFDVGFQLSYLAVFGIVWLQPKLKSLLNFKNKIFNFFWNIFTVSVAAQIFILPVSLYYFNQFPSLFWLTNLVVIPFLGFILGGSLLVILCSFLFQIPSFIKLIFEGFFNLMNSYIGWVADQESFLISNLYITIHQTIVLYIVLFFLVLFFVYKKYNFLFISLIAVILLQINLLFFKAQNYHKSEFIVFHQAKKRVFTVRLGSQMFTDDDSKDNTIIQLYQKHQQLEVEKIKNFENILKIKNQHFLLIDSLGLYHLKNLKNPVVIISNSPKINMERLIKTLEPKKIVVDGSNYKSYVKSWEEKAKMLKTPFYSTAKNGAFVYTIE